MSDRSTVVLMVLGVLGLTVLAGVMPPAQAQLNTGDILVVDYSAGTGGRGALFRVDSSTGARTLLSDFGVGANQGSNPYGVAVESSGQILVIDMTAGTGGLGALFRVDPSTGARAVLSDFGVGANPGIQPRGVAVESSGQILVTDDTAGTGNQGALFRVDPSTGARTLLSDFGVGANPGIDPTGVAVESSGQILVIDPAAGTGGLGALFRVDSSTGARALLSDFGVGANPGVAPTGVAVESSGQILVIDPAAGTGGLGALFRVDPSTGARTLLSDFGVGANPGVAPTGVAVESSGQILVTDDTAGTGNQGALFRVDSSTGARALLSDFGVGANPGVNPVGLAVWRGPRVAVGGVVMSASGLAVLAPYLAVVGLACVIAVTVALRKKHRD